MSQENQQDCLQEVEDKQHYIQWIEDIYCAKLGSCSALLGWL